MQGGRDRDHDRIGRPVVGVRDVSVWLVTVRSASVAAGILCGMALSAANGGTWEEVEPEQALEMVGASLSQRASSFERLQGSALLTEENDQGEVVYRRLCRFWWAGEDRFRCDSHLTNADGAPGERVLSRVFLADAVLEYVPGSGQGYIRSAYLYRDLHMVDFDPLWFAKVDEAPVNDLVVSCLKHGKGRVVWRRPDHVNEPLLRLTWAQGDVGHTFYFDSARSFRLTRHEMWNNGRLCSCTDYSPREVPGGSGLDPGTIEKVFWERGRRWRRSVTYLHLEIPEEIADETFSFDGVRVPLGTAVYDMRYPSHPSSSYRDMRELQARLDRLLGVSRLAGTLRDARQGAARTASVEGRVHLSRRPMWWAAVLGVVAAVFVVCAALARKPILGRTKPFRGLVFLAVISCVLMPVSVAHCDEGDWGALYPTSVRMSGPICLYGLARLHGVALSLERLVGDVLGNASSTSLFALEQEADALGLPYTAAQVRPRRLACVAPPSILHVDGNRFILLMEKVGNRYLVLDPLVGKRTFSPAEIENRWDGYALLRSRQVMSFRLFRFLARVGAGASALFGAFYLYMRFRDRMR